MWDWNPNAARMHSLSFSILTLYFHLDWLALANAKTNKFTRALHKKNTNCHFNPPRITYVLDLYRNHNTLAALKKSKVFYKLKISLENEPKSTKSHATHFIVLCVKILYEYSNISKSEASQPDSEYLCFHEYNSWNVHLNDIQQMQ